MGGKMNSVPVLIYTDAPELRSGLGKIGRHIADLLTRMPEFRVGTFGRGGWGARKLPWAQYRYPENTRPDSIWGQDYFKLVCEDFFSGEFGIVFSIMDPSRIHWMTRPQYLLSGPLRDFLENRHFAIWSYLPIDSTGPNGKLSALCADAIAGVDRPLAYSMYGSQVISMTLGKEVEWLPHGINMDTFQPRDRTAMRVAFGIPEDTLVIGTVATNQARKDWGVAAAAMREIRDKHANVIWWLQIDEMVRYWDINALLMDYGLFDITLVRCGLGCTDKELSYMYSMCDMTILPTLGEGFGYPIAESLACGVPCITTDYAGGAELLPITDWLVKPAAFRLDGQFNQIRPVTTPDGWAAAVERLLEAPSTIEECRASVEHLNWPNLFGPWKKWFLEGLQRDPSTHS